ncbi:hypothetical protein BC941DRAFT_425680 [Chlamydoabsidia padenii]|nr:hypothetical protein BC941DRAFT_425680 [Chlamydoabsidia padenii]
MKSNASWVKKITDSSDQVYQYQANAGTPGKLLHRIPFQHPAQLYSIMMYLRQQQTFNSLFTSIFNKETYQPGTSDSTRMARTLSLDEILMASEEDDKLRIEVATYSAPRTIQLSLSPPASTHYPFVSIPVTIDIPTHKACHPRVRLDSAIIDMETTNGIEMVWNPRVFNQDEMNKVLQNEYKIPDLVAWVWKTLEQHEGNYWVERSLKRSHNSMMDLDDVF